MPTIVGLLPALILFVTSLIAAIFSIWWGATIYTAGIYLATIAIVVSCACVRPPRDPSGSRKILLSNEDERLFVKYIAFFRFPFGTQNFAHFVNFARMFGLVWIAIALWQRIYWVAVANAVYFLISGTLMWRLSPIAHYKTAAEKGEGWAVRDLRMIQHILDCRDELGF